jgi:hypothetical protein
VTSSHEIHSEKEQEIHRWNLLTFQVRDTETVFVCVTWLPQFFDLVQQLWVMAFIPVQGA